MDLLTWLFVIGFEGVIVLLAVLLLVTYLSFVRMDKDVRRARMFIMADRIKRTLGALTLGFIALAAAFAAGIAGIAPSALITGAFFFFLGTIGYMIVELFFIVRPRRTMNGRRGRFSASNIIRRKAAAASNEQSEGDGDATN